MSAIHAILPQLQAIYPEDRISVNRAVLEQHARDQSAHEPHLPDAVVWPLTTEEVSQTLRLAYDARIPVTPWGAGTSIEGNPIPVAGGVVLDLSRMDQILTIHDKDFQVTVQPGVLYKDMNKILARYGLFFAPDPGANASIGGMLANNAAGIRTVKYGATRDNVLALEVVLADGRVIRTGSRSVKQSAGYDLTHLFVGSEGTLGVITEATLKLAPIPAHVSAAVARFPTVADAAEAVFDIIGAGLEPAALELLDATAVKILNTDPDIPPFPEQPALFMEFASSHETALADTLDMVRELCQEHRAQGFDTGVGRQERARIWHARHHLFEAHVRYFAGQSFLVGDAAVPISHYPELIARTAALMEEMGVVGSLLGHAGDGNIHTIVFYPPENDEARQRALAFNDAFVGLALEREGTCTGEHGVGLGKRKFMAREHGLALEVMRQLKQTLDPRGILNPGKVLP
ncbi:MAG TPA: FAD-binding protein [Anaerolineae bacterium]|nr:FAD-binding protein [Caldilineae bacterium]HID33807.1 FAD-binding protein [Anaerolineae bacterium]HIQ11455.1 FAD-binding protein [Caldilineales bacterium]